MMAEELLLNDAVMGVYNAIQAGWNETDEWTVETPGQPGLLEIDLPQTRQTIRITVDVFPRG
jgi:hypothetical protein